MRFPLGDAFSRVMEEIITLFLFFKTESKSDHSQEYQNKNKSHTKGSEEKTTLRPGVIRRKASAPK